ncbi:hypothetical protein [Aneurinibacillus terranovensis]|uniref:hypothetical protein n=1 Tax=Aneurinibacillus terranovensis TaxID=278991 RepID=UPI000402C5F3|nr:hypothetical protein [Aneurinibacillus terranovensis]
MSQSDQIHEKINQLLEHEDLHIREIIVEAINLAQTHKQLSAEYLSVRLQRALDSILRGA